MSEFFPVREFLVYKLWWPASGMANDLSYRQLHCKKFIELKEVTQNYKKLRKPIRD